MTYIFVDADACPVKNEVETIASRRKVRVKMVCNGGVRPSANPMVEMVYVADGLDVADDYIADNCKPNYIVITSDIPLAARCIDVGCVVIKPNGEVLTKTNIGNVLATRNLMTDLRDANPFSKSSGGKTFSKSDRSRFSNALDTQITHQSKGNV